MKLWYYPPLEITDFKDKIITQSQSQIVLTVDGKNFINTADELTCVLDGNGGSIKAFNILFLSS